MARTVPVIVRASERRASSPAGWPFVSLNCLNASTSRMITATGCRSRRAARSSRSRWASKNRAFRRPVRPSVIASDSMVRISRAFAIATATCSAIREVMPSTSCAKGPSPSRWMTPIGWPMASNGTHASEPRSTGCAGQGKVRLSATSEATYSAVRRMAGQRSTASTATGLPGSGGSAPHAPAWISRSRESLTSCRSPRLAGTSRSSVRTAASTTSDSVVANEIRSLSWARMAPRAASSRASS